MQIKPPLNSIKKQLDIFLYQYYFNGIYAKIVLGFGYLSVAIRNPLSSYLAKASQFLEIFSPSNLISICGLLVRTILLLFILIEA